MFLMLFEGYGYSRLWYAKCNDLFTHLFTIISITYYIYFLKIDLLLSLSSFTATAPIPRR